MGKRDYDDSDDWFPALFAVKNSLGEAAWDEFCALSVEYRPDEPEDKIRRPWDSMTVREEGNRLTMATFFAEALAAGWEDPGGTSADGGSSGSGGKTDPAAFVLEQSAEAGDELWLDQYGKAHVSMLVEGPDGVQRTVHARIGSKRHKGVISKRYRTDRPNRVLAADQEKRVILLMGHEAREGGAIHYAAMRSGTDGGCIYIDLGRADGKIVRIASEGWTIVDEAPVRFVRGSRGELPLPEAGGTLADLGRHLNLSERDTVRAAAFVIGALSLLPSFPILLIEGRQGTAKSTIGDMILLLCDPPHGAKGGRLTMPRGEQALLIHASNVRVVFLDNLSDITSDEADAVCRLATGGGWSGREHYSDEDESQLNAVRPTIVTCIGTPSGRTDFLDRSMRVTALPIVHRRTEEAVLRAFEADRPRMLGFVFDALAASLRNRATVDERGEAGNLRLSRMADFDSAVEGAAEVLGLTPGEFSASILQEQSTMQAEAALGDPLGEVFARWFSVDEGRTVLEGFATEVLDQVKSLLLDPAQLPASNKLKGNLRRIEPGLYDLGLRVEITEPRGHDRKTRYRITRTEAFQAM